MRWILCGCLLAFAGLMAMTASAEDRKETSQRVLGGVISGLLGEPAQAPDAGYTAQERDRVVSLLQRGEYVTSRQGEPIDLMVYGIPLTRVEHVYTAKPIPPSQTSYRAPTQ